MEDYERARKLLLKEGEEAWNCGGCLWLDEQQRPHFTGWVIVAVHDPLSAGGFKAGETRRAQFRYEAGSWVKGVWRDEA